MAYLVNNCKAIICILNYCVTVGNHPHCLKSRSFLSGIFSSSLRLFHMKIVSCSDRHIMVVLNKVKAG